MSLKIKILRVLKDYKNGLISWRVADILGWNNFELVRVYLSHMTREGYVINDGKHKCDQCGHSVNVYRISAKGRERLHLYS